MKEQRPIASALSLNNLTIGTERELKEFINLGIVRI
jgi:hypothetical protein